TDSPGFFALPKQFGTLFLDEAGEIPLTVQAKLLRPLENREYVRLGEAHPHAILGRLVFATNCDLEAWCRPGTFRLDLLERMRGFLSPMLPFRQILAEDPEAMRCYVRAFIAAKIHRAALVDEWTERILASLRAKPAGHPWPGNLREL